MQSATILAALVAGASAATTSGYAAQDTASSSYAAQATSDLVETLQASSTSYHAVYDTSSAASTASAIAVSTLTTHPTAKPTGAAGYTTKLRTAVVPSIVTYCPEPTVLSYNSKTYAVTAPGTVTITDCPCTVTYPVVPAPATVKPAPWYPMENATETCYGTGYGTGTAPSGGRPPRGTGYTAPVGTGRPISSAPAGTPSAGGPGAGGFGVTTTTAAPAGSPPPPPPSASPSHGAASVLSASGAALVGVVAVVAYLL